MKKTLVGLAALLASLGVFAQGSMIFGNTPATLGNSTGAPVGFLGDLRPGAPAGGNVARVSGNTFLSQLIVAGVPVAGTIQPFRTGGAIGFITSTTVSFAGVSAGSTVQTQLAAWVADLGADYATALAKNLGGTGISNSVGVTLVEPNNPAQPAMVGLNGFNIAAVIPEPSLASLGLLGAAVLFLRRKK
ncbi:MAG: hypothetical protein ACKVYV_18575 [Limisphaerales bacterium]